MRFLMIDKIIGWQIGGSAKAVKNISLSEDFFDDHFPRMPIMPGILILEGMAQLGGIFLEETVKENMGIEKKAIMTIIDKTKFRDISKPGDSLIYTAKVISFNDSAGKVQVEAHREDRLIVSSKITFVLDAYNDPILKRDRERLIGLWKEGLDE